MAKFRKIKEEITPEKQNEKPYKRFNFRLLIRLAACFTVVFGIYVYCIRYAEINRNIVMQEITLWTYLIITTLLGCLFVIFNRGLSRDIPTERDLPTEWDRNKKLDYIEKCKKGKEKAKTVLIFFIPFLLTLFIDIINIFFFG